VTLRSSVKWIVAAVVLTLVLVMSLGRLRCQRTEAPKAFAPAIGRVEATEYEIAIKRAGRIVEVFPGVVTSIALNSQVDADGLKGRKDEKISVFRIKIKIDAELVKQRLKKIENGLTRTAYVHFHAVTPWPESLHAK